MASDLWQTRVAPGSCLTVFTSIEETSASSQGIYVRWIWHDKPGFDPAARRMIRGFEIEEAFETCSDLGEHMFGQVALGILMHPDDFAYLKQREYFVSGGSLAIPFWLGLLGYHRAKGWPVGCVAWGAIRPIRNNSFTVSPVANVESKVAFARSIGASSILHPRAENLDNLGSAANHRLSESIEKATEELCEILVGGSNRVY